MENDSKEFRDNQRIDVFFDMVNKNADMRRETNYKGPEKNYSTSSNKPKRTIKNSPQKNRNKRFKIGSILLGLAVATTIGIESRQEIKNYKEETFSECLSECKKIMGASSIYDNSSITGSNSKYLEYVVHTTDGKKHVYNAKVEDGQVTVVYTDDLSEDVRTAISAVGNAKNGNIFDVLYAKKIVEKMRETPESYTILQEKENDFTSIEYDNER